MRAWITFGDVQWEYIMSPRGLIFTHWKRSAHGRLPNGAWPEMHDVTGEVR